MAARWCGRNCPDPVMSARAAGGEHRTRRAKQQQEDDAPESPARSRPAVAVAVAAPGTELGEVVPGQIGSALVAESLSDVERLEEVLARPAAVDADRATTELVEHVGLVS